jgi:hypothetical protein
VNRERLFTIAGGGFFITAFLSIFSNNAIMKFAVPVMLLVTGGLLTATYLVQKSPEIPATPNKPPFNAIKSFSL